MSLFAKKQAEKSDGLEPVVLRTISEEKMMTGVERRPTHSDEGQDPYSDSSQRRGVGVPFT
jgi:hypothetical protein